jgi:uncharacterized protein (TIGR01244 family)
MKIFVHILMFITMASCAHKEAPKGTTQVQQNVQISPNFKAQQYSDIYFSGQPPLADFTELKRQGFATVVNLRQSKENDYNAKDEKAAVEKSGLNYVHIPMSGDEPLTDEKIQTITQAVVKTRKEGKTLVHCSTGNRAGLWAGGHFYKDHGYSKEESMKVAEQLGLTNSKLKKNLQNYLNK